MKKRIICIALMFILCSTGCGSNTKIYEGHSSGYTEVTCVNGAKFDMYTPFLELATAITTISPDGNYSGNTYLYKDGNSQYLFFNMDSLIVVVEKGTEFDFQSSSDYGTTISNSDISGVWFSPDNKKLVYSEKNKNNVYKIVTEVEAEVSITPTLYGSFVGKFASIKYDNQEYSMFIGVPGDTYKDIPKKQKEIISHIAATFTKGETVAENTNKEIKNVEKPSEETNTNEPTTVTVKSNQGRYENMSSDIYHMLQIGDTGTYRALSNSGKTTEESCITIQRLYTGEDAKRIIRDYCKSDESLFSYSDAPDGSSWHVVEYTLEKSPEDLYTDIKIEGLDGGKLRFRGVSYSSRTHDIFKYITKTDKGYSKVYCYYPVPNGCTEYMLECGTNVETDTTTACYYIGNFR